MKIDRGLLFGLWGLVASASDGAVTLIISDQTFAPASWAAIDYENIGPVAHLEQQMSAGGNPGEFRSYAHSFTEGTGFHQIEVFHAFSGQTYTPSVQGAILSLSYSEDSISLSGDTIGAAIGLMQNGVVFVGPDLDFSDTSWFTQTRNGLAASDFASVFLRFSPDFGDSGAEITFGFVRSSGRSSQSVSNSLIQGGIDNWSVAITSIPEPSSFSLLGFGLFLILRRRKIDRAFSKHQNAQQGAAE